MADGETFTENGTEVWWESKAKGRFDVCEFCVGEAIEDGDVRGLEVMDEGLCIGCKRKAD